VLLWSYTEATLGMAEHDYGRQLLGQADNKEGEGSGCHG
jgi:hypothetical protein